MNKKVTTHPPPAHSEIRDEKSECKLLLRGLLHELRNPLSSILTASGLLQDLGGEHDENQLLLGVIKKESLRLNVILTRFADYMKLPPPQLKDVDIAELLSRVLHQLQGEDFFPKNIEVKTILPSSCQARADSTQLQIVFRNLIENAVQAMPGGGVLEIELKQESQIEISFRDTGDGFTAESSKRAFEPFYSTREKRVGLGLAYVHEIMLSHGGQIRIENSAPKGASVRLSSPIFR